MEEFLPHLALPNNNSLVVGRHAIHGLRRCTTVIELDDGHFTIVDSVAEASHEFGHLTVTELATGLPHNDSAIRYMYDMQNFFDDLADKGCKQKQMTAARCVAYQRRVLLPAATKFTNCQASPQQSAAIIAALRSGFWEVENFVASPSRKALEFEFALNSIRCKNTA